MVSIHILIIKLDALGDVLRTTCILDALFERHPNCRVTWITRSNAVCLFEYNPLVAKVIEFPGDALAELMTTSYDLVINLDASATSGQLATIANAEEKLGFGVNEKGAVFPFNEEARDWYEMGLFDDLKLSNTKTYQQIALEICRLPPHNRRLHLYLKKSERLAAKHLIESRTQDQSRMVIGLNTGASGRWPHKKWTVDGYISLVDMLASDPRTANAKILLLGGDRELERNLEIECRTSRRAISMGTHDLRIFFAIIQRCNALVTGDTLALHAALALSVPTLVLIGPTSAAEIDLYGIGEKIVSDAPCVGKYLVECAVSPTCMERIRPRQVFNSLQRLVAGVDVANIRYI